MTEKKLLWISIYATGGFSLMGIIWGVAAGSGIIIFDGLYSLVSLGLSFLSLLTLREINKGESERFPFGRAQFEPVLVAFKSVMIIGMCVYAAFDSFALIFRGGREVAIGSALAYAVINSVGCLSITLLLVRYSRKINSSLLVVEKNQWIGDSLLSFCILLAFAFASTVLERFYPSAIPYVDPVMVVVASAFFLILPGKSLLAALREILFVRADNRIVDPLESEAKKVAKDLDARYKLHAISIGRQLEVEVNFLMGDRKFSVAEMDAVRQRFLGITSDLAERTWINVNFTMDESQL